MHLSQFADQLRCQHCAKTHGARQWPVNGDIVPFYFQKEASRFSLSVTCPHCGKEWYVVWDDNPGPIMSLRADNSSPTAETYSAGIKQGLKVTRNVGAETDIFTNSEQRSSREITANLLRGLSAIPVVAAIGTGMMLCSASKRVTPTPPIVWIIFGISVSLAATLHIAAQVLSPSESEPAPLTDQEITEQLIAAGDLGASSRPPETNRMVARLYGEDDRINAGLEIGKLKDPAYIEPLIARLRHVGTKLGPGDLYAVTALEKIGAPAVQPLINELVTGKWPWAAMALGFIGDKRAVDPLLAVLSRKSDASPELRQAAETALGKIESDEAGRRYRASIAEDRAATELAETEDEETLFCSRCGESNIQKNDDGRYWCSWCGNWALGPVSGSAASKAGRARALAQEWWKTARMTVAACDKCNAHLTLSQGYLCQPKQAFESLETTPDLVCESCFEKWHYQPWAGRI